MNNQALETIFNEIADLLELKEESGFRVNAYRRVARAIGSLTEDVQAIADRGALEEIPGIGKSLAEKIFEFLDSDKVDFHEKLLAELPVGLITLARLSGVGPKTARLIHASLGISTLDELEAAARAGRLRTLPRMGKKSEENVLRGIEQARRQSARTPIGIARPMADDLVAALRALPQVRQISVAGSLRRMRDRIGDLDVLVTSDDPDPVMDAFVRSPWVLDVLAHGPSKSSVTLRTGVQADLRVVPPEAFGAALQYFTGSKEHNAKVRERAVRAGLRLNEYGLFRADGEQRIAAATEEEIYDALGMPWIPPEMREDLGEVEAAVAGALPRLVEAGDIRGDLHMHTKWSDGSGSAAEMARAAKALGYEYVCITDHSQSLKFAGGVPPEDLRAHIAEVRALSNKKLGIEVLIGAEVDILADGSLDYDDDLLAALDLAIASVHSRFRMTESEMTARVVRAMRNPYVTILGHPTGRLIGQRDPYALDIDAVIREAAATGTILELNAAPERLDLKDDHLRRARANGVQIEIGSDAHAAEGLALNYGIGTARRAWLTAENVVNALPLVKLRAALRRKRGG
ncbi:MAG: DNA polymerase/3'-5' exonuclease PolX [Armatimonadetes bacterium]|nr:DNA polymerase/3'-5' exonuclease PolX [Armatimonadota bacterium]